jgi:hypothetical protein
MIPFHMKTLSVVASSLVLMAISAVADPVTYTVTGWGPNHYPAPTTPPANAPLGVNGYPGDTLQLVTYTGSLELTPGTSTLKINTLDWKIDYTYGGTATAVGVYNDVVFNLTALRSISFNGGPMVSLGQEGRLTSTFDNDYWDLYAGSTSSALVNGYQVSITPQALNTSGSYFEGSNPWQQPQQDVMATFTVAVPEPETLGLLVLAGSGLILFLRTHRLHLAGAPAPATVDQTSAPQ